MAIDKSHTSPLMKVGIVLLAATFVLGIGFAGLSGLSSCSASAPLLPGSPAAEATSTVESTQSVAAKYEPQIAAIDASLTVNPKSYPLLVSQAENYFGWAYDSQNTSKDASAAAPLWAKARTFFERAIAVESTEAAIIGDYAITLYYSGDVTAAIATAEKSRKLDPTLAQNLFNLGNFYAAAGDKAKAIASYQAYIASAPSGDLVQKAKDNIATLQK
jgi:tetratricopeptide (TPR) repeat protein